MSILADPDERPDLIDLDRPTLWERLWEPGDSTYWLTRYVILRLLGLVYLVAFWTFVMQGLPLLGSKGLLPVAAYLERAETTLGFGRAVLQLPTLFWFSASDGVLVAVALLGAALSLIVLLGYANGIILLELWVLYISIVHVGQDWYSFGWEIQLLETGFLAVFLCPLMDGRPFPARRPPVVVIWLYRWLIFRIMLGAGLIKMRGDPCWSDLTCLAYHYETQPVPNPLSPVLHFMPVWFHKLGVLFNHLSEMVAPFFVFGPRRARHVAGILLVSFQLFLIASGNLSFLNWLTIVPALACLDDSFWKRVLPEPLVERAARAREGPTSPMSQRVAVTALAAVVALLSINPVANLLSSRQAMNTSFDRFHLVNTYGAFGVVGKERLELVFEGTTDEAISETTEWKSYEFECKPTSLDRRPCLITPYHYRLDWLLWFAAMGSPERYPWSAHLVWKLLHNDAGTLSLMEQNPFPDEPPKFIRVQLYRYEFAPLDEDAWWVRTPVGSWLPAVSVEDRRFREFLDAYGWLE